MIPFQEQREMARFVLAHARAHRRFLAEGAFTFGEHEPDALILGVAGKHVQYVDADSMYVCDAPRVN